MDAYLFFTLTVCVVSSTGSTFGILIGSVFKKSADVMAPVVMVPFALLSGYAVNACSYNVFFSYLQYLSPMRFALEALYWNEFDPERFPDVPISMLD